MYYLEANVKKTSIPENGPPSTNKIKTIAVVKAGNSRALIFPSWRFSIYLFLSYRQ